MLCKENVIVVAIDSDIGDIHNISHMIKMSGLEIQKIISQFLV